MNCKLLASIVNSCVTYMILLLLGSHLHVTSSIVVGLLVFGLRNVVNLFWYLHLFKLEMSQTRI